MSRFKLSIAAAAALLSLLAVVIYWSSSSSLEAQIDRLRAAGEPVRLADLARAPIPDDANAWTYLQSSRGQIESLDRELSMAGRSYGQPDISDRDLQLLELVLESHPEALAAIERALACEHFDPQVDYSIDPNLFITQSLPRVQQLRTLARIEVTRAASLAAAARHDEAAGASSGLFRLAQFADQEPLLVSFLVGCAIRYMAISTLERSIPEPDLSKASRTAIDDALAASDPAAPFVASLRGERAMGMDMWRSILSTKWPITWWFERFYRGYLDRMQHQVDLGAEPYFLTADKMAAFDAEHGPFGPIDAARLAMDRTRAQMRSLRVLNALYGGGHDPARDAPEIGALGLPAEATIDPFTGKPLVIKSDGQRWIVYSLGPDQVDDGGDFKQRPTPKAQRQASTRAIPWLGDVGVGSAPEQSTPSATSNAAIVAP